MKTIKKLVTVFTLLIATSCAPAFADVSEKRLLLCQHQHSIANKVMKIRQMGIPKAVLENDIKKNANKGVGKDLTLAMLPAAYSYPLVTDKQGITEDFSLEVYSRCLNGQSTGLMEKYLTKEEWLKL